MVFNVLTKKKILYVTIWETFWHLKFLNEIFKSKLFKVMVDYACDYICSVTFIF